MRMIEEHRDAPHAHCQCLAGKGKALKLEEGRGGRTSSSPLRTDSYPTFLWNGGQGQSQGSCPSLASGSSRAQARCIYNRAGTRSDIHLTFNTVLTSENVNSLGSVCSKKQITPVGSFAMCAAPLSVLLYNMKILIETSLKVPFSFA